MTEREYFDTWEFRTIDNALKLLSSIVVENSSVIDQEKFSQSLSYLYECRDELQKKIKILGVL